MYELFNKDYEIAFVDELDEMYRFMDKYIEERINEYWESGEWIEDEDWDGDEEE